jgi:hypothetical protein
MLQGEVSTPLQQQRCECSSLVQAYRGGRRSRSCGKPPTLQHSRDRPVGLGVGYTPHPASPEPSVSLSTHTHTLFSQHTPLKSLCQQATAEHATTPPPPPQALHPTSALQLPPACRSMDATHVSVKPVPSTNTTPCGVLLLLPPSPPFPACAVAACKFVRPHMARPAATQTLLPAPKWACPLPCGRGYMPLLAPAPAPLPADTAGACLCDRAPNSNPLPCRQHVWLAVQVPT